MTPKQPEAENGTLLKQLVASLVKQGPLGTIIVILFLGVYLLYDHTECTAEKARQDVIECYKKRTESTKQMIQENNETQGEMIKAINDLRHAINRLSEKIDK